MAPPVAKSRKMGQGQEQAAEPRWRACLAGSVPALGDVTTAACARDKNDHQIKLASTSHPGSLLICHLRSQN